MLFVLFGLWVLFNGRWTAEIAVVGAVISVLLYAFMCAFMEFSPKKELRFLLRLPRYVYYLGWLIGQIFLSAWQTIGFIWSPKYEVEPELVSFRTKLKTEGGKVLLADSITLTPGTITVDVKNDEFLVTCLDTAFAEGMKDGNDMEAHVLKTEGGARK